jgi:hypothetical protein
MVAKSGLKGEDWSREAAMDQFTQTLKDPDLIAALQNSQLKEALRSIIASPFEVPTLLALIAAAVVTGVSAAIIFLQLRLDHERSRRQTAVDLIRLWTASQMIETSTVIRLVQKFSPEQCEALVDNKAILIMNIDVTTEDILNCLTAGFPNLTNQNISQDGKIVITGRYCTYVRFRTMQYLNTLEAILAAWNCGIARRDIIEEQFRFLRLAPGADLLKYRLAYQNLRGGNDAFPSISNFMSAMRPKISKPLTLVDSILGG